MNNNEINIRFNYKVWLETENGEGIFGYGLMRLLKALEESGTLKTASNETGLNFKKSWAKLKKVEQILGFKIIRTREEDDHKFTKLTEEGKLLIKSIEDFSIKYEKLIDQACAEATTKLNKKIAELKN